jgi:asparagine synthetase B (glutamine-hydrolysing)
VDSDPAAHQPFSDADAALTLAFNGEIYNYREIRSKLPNYPFRTQSDTEVLLAAVATWGLAGLTTLRGMFAGVIVNTATRRVYLFRDPIGKKPLFVAENDGEVVFGSSVLAIRAASDRPGRLDAAAVDGYWRYDYVPPNQSALEGCRPVMPGEVLEYDWWGRRLQTHSCRPKAPAVSTADWSELKASLTQLIDQSIDRRLLNNPRPVTLLSGGIDSTVVTWAAARLATVEAITLGSRLNLAPDARYAKYAAQRLKLALQPVHLSSGSVADRVKWAFSLQDEPLGMMSFFMLAHLIQAAAAYGRILLTGDGGDEVFLGYGQADDWVVREHSDENSAGPSWMVGPPLPTWMTSWARFNVQHQLLGHMFPKLDRAASEQGVETRSPLLDWDVFAFARALPPEVLLREGRVKALLKGQLADWPDGFIERPKVGFTFHLRWLWLSAGFAGARELVSAKAVERFEERLPQEMRCHPKMWSAPLMFRNFKALWKLMAWSSFESRFDATDQASPADDSWILQPVAVTNSVPA